MRFLVDQALSPQLALGLSDAGHDASHLRDYQMQRASDEDVLERAAAEERVVITPDSDFAALLALRGATGPSVLIVRASRRRADAVLAFILANLPALEPALASGSIVVLEDTRIRIRSLPIGREEPPREDREPSA